MLVTNSRPRFAEGQASVSAGRGPIPADDFMSGGLARNRVYRPFDSALMAAPKV